MKRTKGSTGQAPRDQDGDPEDDDLDGQNSEDDDQDDQEEEEEDDENKEPSGQKPKGTDLDRLTPEQKDAEIIRLRQENARRRTANRSLREQVRAQEESRKGKKSPDDLEKENSDLRAQVANLTVQGSLRDYVAEKHPEYAKLTRRIAKFVDLEDVDLNDPDSIQDAVASAVEEFVRDVPMSKGRQDDEPPVTDSSGRPVGAPGSAPARRAAGESGSLDRRKQLFPGIYSGPKA